MLRKHQAALREICWRIKDGNPIRTVIAHVTCGGGKSLLPVVAASELMPHVIDKICWVCPRTALQYQAEEGFCDPFFRKLLEHDLSIRIATNEVDPSRGLAGYATTYQALAQDKEGVNLAEFRKHRYCLVLDENAHVYDDASVMPLIDALVDQSRLVILMSGTLERGNKGKIAFLNYDETAKKRYRLDLHDTDYVATINYSRTDALIERAIIPLRFTYLDAKARFKMNDNNVVIDSVAHATGKTAKQALFTAMNTQYAYELLSDCVNDWLNHRKKAPGSKLLVVAANQKLARMYHDHLTKQDINCGLAISDEGSKNVSVIKKFRSTGGGSLPALVSVAIAYEGLDVKQITHIACLTLIRSQPWLTQLFARAARYDPSAGPWDTQEARVFMPDDIFMREVTGRIEREQRAFVKNAKVSRPVKEDAQRVKSTVAFDLFGDIVPIGSSASGKRIHHVGEKSVVAEPPRVLTPSEKEKQTRDDIEMVVRRYSGRHRVDVYEVNGRMKKQFGKPRPLMTQVELDKVLEWSKENLQ